MYTITQLIRFFILLAVLLAWPSGQASAALRGCRTDPIFSLSNGDVIAVTLEVGTPAHNIRTIHYVLHLPPNVSVERVTYTGGPRQAMKESYVVYQGSAAKTYTTDTIVTILHTQRVAVKATTRLNGVFAQSAAGYDGDHLVVTVVKR